MAKFVQTTLIDGYAGGPHVTEAQLGLAHQATFGSDDYVLEGGRESEAQVLTNNSIRIFDAVYCIQGRRDVIPASGYTDVTIANGTQGMNRNDIIVRRYKKNESSEIESTEYAVIKGTPNAGTAVDPEVTIGDIRSGATLHEMALYRVKLTGLNITAVEPMFNILKNMATLQKEFTELNSKIKNFNTDKTLWSGSVINQNVELSDSIYNFRWIYIETEDGIVSPILIRKGKNTYLTGYGYASSPRETVTVGIKLTINTATNINILSHYVVHRFNSTHPDLSARRVTAIYGVPTYS